MLNQYTKTQLWELYKKLPEELKEAISSLDNTDNIYDICEQNNVPEEIIPDISRVVGHVLLGVLLPDQFQSVLEQELSLEKETAKKVAREINRFVFYPVKPLLEDLHKIEINPPAGEKQKTEVKIETETEKKEAQLSKDTYREPIE